MPATRTFDFETADDGAIVARHGDVTLRTAFQPVFRFQNGRLSPVACEALLRVMRGTTPVLTDAWFSSLDMPEFRQIEPELRRLHIRNARHLPPGQQRLFLNFDPRIPESGSGFDAILRELGSELRDAGISPADVVCEITEAHTDRTEILTHLSYELRARGFLIAVDDFGAHASRLGRVTALAPDIVKFDGNLVQRLLATRAGFGTLATLVARFRDDGIHSVLEGLEALWQVGLAEKADAAMVQGYVLAAPRLAGPDLPAWLGQYHVPRHSTNVQLAKRYN
ncbi:EAL domain-containing protein [Oricola cellulosilytica]|uniref:EAL domain-containing protein n=1 Tax=Oricola cellulosilytica TaxID=1429082 RepID=UPI001304C59A|nr:EAL domain-containing protein [Oricola cellulosilytica]